jgi:hypothetical protein
MYSPAQYSTVHLHTFAALPETLSENCKLWVMLECLKSSGRGPLRHTSHPELYHPKAGKP